MLIIRTQSICLCIFLCFEEYSSCDIIHKTRLNTDGFLLVGNIGILPPYVKENILKPFIFKEFLNNESFTVFDAGLHVMVNFRIGEFHLWAMLEKNNADCWGAEVRPLSTSCFNWVPIAVITHHD